MPATPFLANDFYVYINGVDLSANAFNVDLKLEKDKVDASGFNPTGSKTWLPGQRDEEVVVSFRQDFSSARVDATLWPLYDNGTTFAITLRPTSGTVSPTNPSYIGSANLYEYHPMDAEVGNVSETQVTFAYSGPVTRGTA